ncbi:hypothetical protein [Nisaea nitritireducens]|uniref:hypothetical protein n=1 Tax=Nisaea nitritireducens TaxID=568392 RepID=UPI001865BFAF|nr:hypothetical protein [Nisaea nitritireducens]
MNDRLKNLYDRVKEEQAQAPEGIATKAELDNRVALRDNYLPVPENNYPPPGWQDNPHDPEREAMRENEQHINRLDSQLTEASVQLEQDFEQSR